MSVLNISLWSFSTILLFYSSFSLVYLSVVWYFLILGFIVLVTPTFLYFSLPRDVLLSSHSPSRLSSKSSLISLLSNPFYWSLNVPKIFSLLLYSTWVLIYRMLNHRTLFLLFFLKGCSSLEVMVFWQRMYLMYLFNLLFTHPIWHYYF